MIARQRASERILGRVIREQKWLDPLAETVQKWIGAFYDVLGAPGTTIKNVLHGTRVLGHPLHPALTDVPIGAWTVGIVADWLYVVTGRVPPVAGDRALAGGLAAAIVTALAGHTDFHETARHERRTAIVHGLTMTGVVVIDLVSLVMRLGIPGTRVWAIVQLDGDVVTCPWHYSRFRFGDGKVVGGPAIFDQPPIVVREPGGLVEVKLGHPLSRRPSVSPL